MLVMISTSSEVIQFPGRLSVDEKTGETVKETRTDAKKALRASIDLLTTGSARRLSNAKKIALAIQRIQAALQDTGLTPIQREQFAALDNVMRISLKIIMSPSGVSQNLQHKLTLAEVRLKKAGGENPFKLVR
jgi:hypothetical protein